MQLQTFREFTEASDKSVVFTFGRLNPMTSDHGKLLDKVASRAKRSDYKIYLSQSQDPKKNPLEYNEKVKWARKMFPKHARNIIEDKDVKNVFDILVKLYNAGYNKVTMVVGSDRVPEFEKLLSQYNGTKARHGFYEFDSIDIVSTGEHDPDAEGVEGLSSSKMRAAVTDDDFDSFKKCLPKGFKDGAELFNLTKQRMGIKESVQIEIETSTLRERYIAGEIFNVGDSVKCENVEFKIAKRGPNYVESEFGKKYFINNLTELE
jgi:hypothetical protein